MCPELHCRVRGDLGTLRVLGWEPDKVLLSHAASVPTEEAGLSGDPCTLSQSQRQQVSLSQLPRVRVPL